MHKSPYATWNPLMAWIRLEGSAPDRITLVHLGQMEDHAELVVKGIRRVLDHYEAGEIPIDMVPIQENTYQAWQEQVRGLLEDRSARWVVDVTPARTVAKLAAMGSIRPVDATHVLYLDVGEYRYDAKPFPWIPYNLQSVRLLREESRTPPYHRVQRLREPPGLAPVSRFRGVQRTGPGRYEVTLPWDALTVLLNEAAATGTGNGAGRGAGWIDIKLPALGVHVATYDLESRRFRLTEFTRVRDQIERARNDLDGLWRNELPGATAVLESLASARLLPFEDQTKYETMMHEVARQTRGPNPGTALKAIALDTNLFYQEFFTAVTHATKVPMIRIPVVASAVTLNEIRHQMGASLPAGPKPRILEDSSIHHAYKARQAHSAHEEFEMLRTRCRMHVIQGEHGLTPRGPEANDHNDQAIVEDLRNHVESERQELLVLSSDRGFVKRARRQLDRVDVQYISYADPGKHTVREADIDQIAYLIYRLALRFGRASLRGMDVQVMGDHPRGEKRQFLHENVRIDLPDSPWARAFLHEETTRELLEPIVAEGRVWL